MDSISKISRLIFASDSFHEISELLTNFSGYIMIFLLKLELFHA